MEIRTLPVVLDCGTNVRLFPTVTHPKSKPEREGA